MEWICNSVIASNDNSFENGLNFSPYYWLDYCGGLAACFEYYVKCEPSVAEALACPGCFSWGEASAGFAHAFPAFAAVLGVYFVVRVLRMAL